MVPERVHRRLGRASGFGTIELIVVVAIVGVVAVVAAPNLLAAWRVSAFSAGVAEVSAALNRARQLAVTESTSVCVQPERRGVRLRTRGCTGPVWTGPGTDPTGSIRVSGELEVEGTAIVFTRLGAAAPAGTLTARDPATGRARRITVAATGQISTR